MKNWFYGLLFATSCVQADVKIDHGSFTYEAKTHGDFVLITTEPYYEAVVDDDWYTTNQIYRSNFDEFNIFPRQWWLKLFDKHGKLVYVNKRCSSRQLSLDPFKLELVCPPF